MLNRLPPDVLSLITDLLPGAENRSLWFTGNVALLTSLKNGGIASLRIPFDLRRKTSRAIVWPHSFIKALSGLRNILFEPKLNWVPAISEGLDLRELPKRLRSLQLSGETFPESFGIPLSHHLPNLTSLHLRYQNYDALVTPWPSSLTDLTMIHTGNLSGLLKHLVDLPSTLTSAVFEGRYLLDGTPIVWPSLTSLGWNVHAPTLHFVSDLPRTLTQLSLELNVSEGAAKESIWSLLPPSLTDINVVGGRKWILAPTPGDLKRFPLLRQFAFEDFFSLFDDDLDDGEQVAIDAYWQACPHLESLDLPCLDKFVSDTNIVFAPRNFRRLQISSSTKTRSIFQPEERSDKKAVVFTPKSFALLPPGLHTLVVRAPFSIESLEGITLPSGLKTLGWHPSSGNPLYPLPTHFLPRSLTNLHIACQPIIASTAALYLPHLESLVINMATLPPSKDSTQLPNGLKDLRIDWDNKNVTFLHPPIWEHYDVSALPRSLTSFCVFISDKPVFTHKFFKWISDLPYHELTALTMLNIRVMRSYRRSVAYETTDLAQLSVGEAILQKIKNLRQLQHLTLIVQQFRPEWIANLPSTLSSVTFDCFDTSMSSLSPEHLHLFSRNLESHSYYGCRPSVTSVEWKAAGLPMAIAQDHNDPEDSDWDD